MEPKDVLVQLKKIPLFRNLSDGPGEADLVRLVPFARERVYQAGGRILTEGEPPDRLCLIVRGKVKLTAADADGAVQQIGTLQDGDVFGRKGLLVNQFDDVTVEAEEETHVLYILFRELVRSYDQSTDLRKQLEGTLKPANAVALLQTIPLFQNLQDASGEMELYRIAERVHDQVYGNGEWLFRQGENSDRLLLVLEGRIRLTKVDPKGLTREVGWLEVGAVAGETGLLVGDFHDVIATADRHARVLYLLREDFNTLLAERPRLWQRLNTSADVSERRKVRKHDWLRDDEWVVAEVQRHWSRLLRQIIAPMLFMMLLAPVLYMMGASENTAVVLLGSLVGLLIIALFGVTMWQYLNWRDDYFVLTTQRVVHIERVWPFKTDSEEGSLDKIQDVYEVRAGLTANILNFGNLVLQTAGETVDIDMDNVPNPSSLREMIFQQIERSKARDLLRARGQIRELLARRLNIEKLPSQEEPGITPPTRDRRRMWFLLPFSLLWEYLFPPSWSESEDGGTITLRRFWFAGIPIYLAASLPLILMTFIGGYFLTTVLEDPGFTTWFVAWLVAETVLLGVFLYYVEDWRNDYFELTPSHIIEVNQRPLLLGATRREARLDRIQNLSFQVPGLLAKVLKYGHVQFETAGREGKFEMKWVRDPAQVRTKISDYQYAHNQRQRQFDQMRRQEELLSWFATYDNLRKENKGL